MAGFTNFATIKLNGKTVFVPLEELLSDQVFKNNLRCTISENNNQTDRVYTYGNQNLN